MDIFNDSSSKVISEICPTASALYLIPFINVLLISSFSHNFIKIKNLTAKSILLILKSNVFGEISSRDSILNNLLASLSASSIFSDGSNSLYLKNRSFN